MSGLYTPPESISSEQGPKYLLDPLVALQVLIIEISRGSYCDTKWHEALASCRQYLGDSDFDQLNRVDSCEQLLGDLSDFQDAMNHVSGPSLVQRLRPSLDPLRNFVTLLAASLGTTTIQTALIWGLMSLVIHAAGRTETLLPETLNMLKDLGHDLEMFQIYETTFAKHASMGDELMDIFADIIIFWTQAIHFLRRNKYEATAAKSWPYVHNRFEDTSKRIRKRSQQIKEKAKALSSTQTNNQAELLKELDRLGLLSSSAHPATSEKDSVFPCNNIPFPINPHFYGRSREMQSIREHLDDGLVSSFRSFALFGTGGIGKTQTALSYAHEKSESGVDAVLWLNCETGLAISRSFFEIASLLQLDGVSEDESSDQNKFLVLKWLRKTAASWLIIMDNVEDLDLIRNAWPVCSHGAILVTSRNDIVSIDPAAGGMEIEVFHGEDGASLLMDLVGRGSYSDSEQKAARDLSDRLGGLALALAVMASQVRLKRKSIADFLVLYEKHRNRLNKERRGIESYYDRSLTTCWSTAFESLSEEAAALLAVIVYVAPDSIPEALFKPQDPAVLPNRLVFCDDEWIFGEALEQLLSSSLIRKDASTEMLFIHRLVQDEYRDFMGPEGRQEGFVMASKLLEVGFPELIDGLPLRNYWAACKLYTQHILILCARYQESKFKPKVAGEFDALLKLMCSCGWYLMESGAWPEELEMMQTAMQLCEDKEGLIYANLANSLGQMECERGHIAEAYKYMGASLQIRQRLLPNDHVEIANGFNNYANIVFLELKPGGCEKALEMYQQSIDITMKHENHRKKFLHIPHTNIARVMGVLKRYDESIEHANLSRKYAIPQMGSFTHFDGLADYHIGNAMFNKGEINEAERYWTRAFQIFNKENETHPTTTVARMKLCCVDMKRGNYTKAVTELQRLVLVAKLNEKSKGDQGETARIIRKLAEAMELKGDHKAAKELKDSAESMRKAIQGERYYELPDSDLSYAMMSFHAWW